MTAPAPGAQSLESWLAENMDEVLQAQAFATEGLPDEPAQLAKALSRSQSEYARMGFLLADAESFVLKAHAVAVVQVRKDYPKPQYDSDERKVLAKADPLYLQTMKLRDDLAVIVAALKSKGFAIMNHRNNACDPRMSTES